MIKIYCIVYCYEDVVDYINKKCKEAAREDLKYLDLDEDEFIEGNILFLSQKGKIDSLHESPIFLDFEKDVSDAQEKIIDLIEKDLSKKIKLVD